MWDSPFLPSTQQHIKLGDIKDLQANSIVVFVRNPSSECAALH